MLFAIVEIHLHVGDGESAVGAGGAGGLHALFDGRHEHAVHVAADQRLREHHAAFRRQRLDAHPHLGELAGAAGLFLVPVFGLAAPGNGGPIGNPRLDQIHLHIEAPFEFLRHDLELQLALAGNNRLADLRIEVIIEGRVLLAQGGEALAEFVQVRPRFGDQRAAGVRRGKIHGLQRDLACGGAQRVAGRGWPAVSPRRRCRRRAARAPVRATSHSRDTTGRCARFRRGWR